MSYLNSLQTISAYWRKNSVAQWCPSDHEHQHYTAKKDVPWHECTYAPEDFNYVFNNTGFRCDDFNNNIDKKILYAGCSFTEGIGLPLEHTWGYQFNEKLFGAGAPYFSVALGGDSIAGQIRKIIVLINSGFNPDLVLINFPNKCRDEILYIDKDNVNSTYLYLNAHSYYDEITEKMYHAWNTRPISYINKYTEMLLLLLDLFCKSKNIPYFVSSWNKDTSDSLKTFYVSHQMSDNFMHIWMMIDSHCVSLPVDRRPFKQTTARDYLHFGPNSHYNYAQDVFKLKGKEILEILNK